VARRGSVIRSLGPGLLYLSLRGRKKRKCGAGDAATRWPARFSDLEELGSETDSEAESAKTSQEMETARSSSNRQRRTGQPKWSFSLLPETEC
jgi:hypothetical protein